MLTHKACPCIGIALLRLPDEIGPVHGTPIIFIEFTPPAGKGSPGKGTSPLRGMTKHTNFSGKNKEEQNLPFPFFGEFCRVFYGERDVLFHLIIRFSHINSTLFCTFGWRNKIFNPPGWLVLWRLHPHHVASGTRVACTGKRRSRSTLGVHASMLPRSGRHLPSAVLRGHVLLRAVQVWRLEAASPEGTILLILPRKMRVEE